ncbi:SGNH/GDSL hydrolase family protein [bacterium]|nr:SGNH/GDSL hydrolase family protein [candidate division CSSED10-310 bacterium]
MRGARSSRRRLAGALVIGLFMPLLFELLLGFSGVTRSYRRRMDMISDIMLADPLLFWRLLPDLDVVYNGVEVRTGPQGWRDWLRGEPPTGALICLGDSVTFGWDVEGTASYPTQLARLLAIRGDERAVINAGVPGYSSLQCRLAWERRLAALSPSVVVLSCGINDRFTGGRTDQQRQAAQSTWQYQCIHRLRHLHTAVLLQQLMRRQPRVRAGGFVDDGSGSMHRVPADQYRSNLEWFATRSRHDGFALVLVNQKTTSDPPGYNEHHLAMQETAAAHGLPLVDMVALVDRELGDLTGAVAAQSDPAPPRETSAAEPAADAGRWNRTVLSLETRTGYEMLFQDNYHPNPRGYRIMAEAVARTIK